MIIKQSRRGGEIKLSAMTGRGEILFGEERRGDKMRAKPSWPPVFVLLRIEFTAYCVALLSKARLRSI